MSSLKMLREKAVSRLEDMMFDEDPLIRRAAVEALLNCLYCEEVYMMVRQLRPGKNRQQNRKTERQSFRAGNMDRGL